MEALVFALISFLLWGGHMKNDNHTLDGIIDNHYESIFLFCKRRVKEESDAYDVVQDTFVDFIEVYPRLQTKEMPIKYLYGIAHNKIADYWKEKKRTNESSIDEEDLSYEMTFQDVTEEDIDDIRRIVVVKLRRSERRLYIEVWRQKRKPKDLAAEYGISESAMYKRIERLKGKIEKYAVRLLNDKQ